MDTPSQSDPLTDTAPRPWLRRFCLLTIAATFSLIAIGGHVTSNDVGLAVPDGFTTFGHFTLTAPLEKWWHDFGTRWEHSHRLKGMVVGMMTIVMAAWLFITYADSRRFSSWLNRSGPLAASIRFVFHAGTRPLLRWSGMIMLLLVIGQGVMGALRVSEISLTLAFIHGIVGQLILCSWIVVAAALGKPWLQRLGSIARSRRDEAMPKLRWAVRGLLLLLIVQLTLGSAVRHFKADKSPPDLMVYGQVVPPMSQDALDQAYTAYYAKQMRVSPDESGVTNRNPFGDPVVTLGDVHLQLAHRVGAVVVLVVGLTVIALALRRDGVRGLVAAPALVFLMLLGTQIALGVMTVLSETAPIMATLHQATGAALIAVATWLAVRIHLAEYPAAATADEQTARPAAASAPAADLSPVPA